MQRADRIGLIVASVLVVLLAAGGAFLLVKRNDTLANDRPVDASVKLTQLEESPTPSAATAPTPVTRPKPGVPVRPNGYAFGYVTQVRGSGTALSIRWDLAELLTGKEADLYAKKQGAVLNTRPYYIANDSHKLKTYDLSSKSAIVVVASDGATKAVTPAQLKLQFGAYKARPWFLYVVDGTVRRMVQVYLPPTPAR